MVCEGLTEIGVCRSINKHRIKDGNASSKGVRFANGGGTNQIEYAKGFLNAGYNVCLFCDSDVEKTNNEKDELIKCGIIIVDSNKGNSIEKQLFEDLPWAGINELISYRIKKKEETSVVNSVKSKYKGEFPSEWKSSDNKEMRTALYEASVVKKNEWFKTIESGEFIGNVCGKYLDQMDGKKMKQQLDELSKWIDNV